METAGYFNCNYFPCSNRYPNFLMFLVLTVRITSNKNGKVNTFDLNDSLCIVKYCHFLNDKCHSIIEALS